MEVGKEGGWGRELFEGCMEWEVGGGIYWGGV